MKQYIYKTAYSIPNTQEVKPSGSVKVELKDFNVFYPMSEIAETYLEDNFKEHKLIQVREIKKPLVQARAFCLANGHPFRLYKIERSQAIINIKPSDENLKPILVVELRGWAETNELIISSFYSGDKIYSIEGTELSELIENAKLDYPELATILENIKWAFCSDTYEGTIYTA
jgi:hypothetical protein